MIVLAIYRIPESIYNAMFVTLQLWAGDDPFDLLVRGFIPLTLVQTGQ